MAKDPTFPTFPIFPTLKIRLFRLLQTATTRNNRHTESQPFDYAQGTARDRLGSMQLDIFEL
ncbi:MAG: hypothetical protein P2A85_14185 [Microcoleus anatoxicus]|uniref:hypothetical protein n=1 Tax=Microcoleus anatoxicus TaxID=2705319 RepID=UPI00366AF6C8